MSHYRTFYFFPANVFLRISLCAYFITGRNIRSKSGEKTRRQGLCSHDNITVTRPRFHLTAVRLLCVGRASEGAVESQSRSGCVCTAIPL